jgi:hypothetical protein
MYLEQDSSDRAVRIDPSLSYLRAAEPRSQIDDSSQQQA